MMVIISICLGLILLYLLFTRFLFFLVHQIPRNPVLDPPARGKCLDKKIPAVDGELNWKVGRSELLFLYTDGAETGIEW